MKTSAEALQACAIEEPGKIRIKCSLFSQYHIYVQKRMLLTALSRFEQGGRDITSKHISQCIMLTQVQSGKEVHLPNDLVVRRIYEELIIMNKEEDLASYCSTLTLGTNLIKEANICLTLTLVSIEIPRLKSENLYTKYIDYGKIKGEIGRAHV